MDTVVKDGRETATATRGRRIVASFDSYGDAQRAVDRLSDRGFPVERTAIVARGLEYVEQVTGRAGYLDAAIRGMFPGAIAGVLIRWLFGVFDWFNPVISSVAIAINGLWCAG